ncbi:cation diffusion facilitator transporter [Actinorhabdospora filicis]|uniref:Cation diffusion facilitator transporter n=1 Tax=Actinorhabdospora filicis TaxID=1785913 RepID=A0A9W6SSY6_9ACTN|nr:cation diffusion facilitator family transporter [Actinorhabdospora filicis]GLZ81768.1 cation diffusion facilitator transporter [Actinorhabdospora filicis]
MSEAAAPSPAEGTESESVGTVVLAGAMNLAIAAAKGVAGFLSGSSAMLSEAMHSVADTTTEVFLFVALRRSAKPADRRHPLGYGREAYLWAFLAAAFTFVAGGGFSIGHGIQEMGATEEPGDYLVSYIVLAISFILESVSLVRGLRQTRGEARRWGTSSAKLLKYTPDTTLKAVVLEDTAALAGLVIAAAGLGLSEITRSPFWDGLASVLIGVLLLAVAGILAWSNVSLLIGQSVPQKLRELIINDLEELPEVVQVRELVALHIGPSDVLVAAKVDFVDAVSAGDIETAADAAERRLRALYPSIAYLFLDPTPGPAKPAD